MKTALVICVVFGLLLLTLEAAEGRLILEEGRQAKQPLSGTNLNKKVTVDGGAFNQVTSSEDSGEGESTDPTHRYFPDLVNPKEKKQNGN